MTSSASKSPEDSSLASGVLDLIGWNRQLACDRWNAERLERLVGRNPETIVLKTTEGDVTIRSNEFYQHNALLTLPGIDSRRIEELRSVGLVAYRAAKSYLYEGRRIIALFCGNLKALDRLEKLLRTGKS